MERVTIQLFLRVRSKRKERRVGGIDVVERICDRIAIIKKGNILVTKTVAEIEESGVTLEDFYMNTINGDKAKNGKN